MKKFITVVLAVLLVAALAVPAFAEEEETIFNTDFYRVDNEPTVVEDEWGVPYNEWNEVPNTTAVKAGDTVTFALTYQVPAEVPGFDAEKLNNIAYVTTIEGVGDLKLVDALGCDIKQNCNYDIGICVPVPGEYENVTVSGNTCTVMAKLNSDVTVVVSGTASAELVSAETCVTIGQCRFPAYFSVGYVEKSEANDKPCYNIHYTDVFNVQKRDLTFRADELGVYRAFVALNGHFHRVDITGDAPAYFPVDEEFYDIEEAISPDSDLYATLTTFYNDFMNFFKIDGGSLEDIGDATFLGDGAHQDYVYEYNFGESAEPVPTNAPSDAPTEAPADDPTEAPVDNPTEAPADTTPPTDNPGVPSTGAVSLVGLGLVSLIGGAVVAGRRRK